MNLNHVMLAGNIGTDITVNSLNQNRIAVTFSLSTTETFLDRNNEQRSVTTWHRVDVTNQNAAKFLRDYAAKGDNIFLTGKETLDKYTSNGNTRYSPKVAVTELDGHQVQMLCRSARNQQSQGQTQSQAA